jgi:hypothetical protein
MAKFKPAKPIKGGAKGGAKPSEAKSSAASAARAIPCLILVLGGMILLFLLLTATLRSQGGA